MLPVETYAMLESELKMADLPKERLLRPPIKGGENRKDLGSFSVAWLQVPPPEKANTLTTESFMNVFRGFLSRCRLVSCKASRANLRTIEESPS